MTHTVIFSKRLHFIIGFTAYSVQPTMVMPFMLRIAVEIYIHKKPVELAVEEVISSWTLLCHTPVVLVCWTRDNMLVSRRYLASTPSGSVWGLNPRCGDRNCQAGPGDIKTIRGRQKDKYLKFHCNRCGWESPGHVSRPSWLIPFSTLPNLLQHHFPLSLEEEDYIRLQCVQRS